MSIFTPEEPTAEQADITFDHDKLYLLHKVLEGYVHMELNCAGTVPVKVRKLQLKLEDYLHG